MNVKGIKRKSCVDLEPYNADYYIYSGFNGTQEECLQNSSTDTTRWLYFADDNLKVHVVKGKVILRYATLLLQDASIKISGNHSFNMDRSL